MDSGTQVKYYNIRLQNNSYQFLIQIVPFKKYKKSKLIQKLNLVDSKVYVAIVDIGMIWGMSTPTQENREKADALIYTSGILSPRLSILLFLVIS